MLCKIEIGFMCFSALVTYATSPFYDGHTLEDIYHNQYGGGFQDWNNNYRNYKKTVIKLVIQVPWLLQKL